VSDDDLRRLEREAALAPLEPRGWLAHAQAALRAGSSDAAASFYRAAALGGDLVETRRGLRALGAAPTPWGHPFGDSRRTRCSPLRGPRIGEVVARVALPFETWGLALAEAGTIHLCGDTRDGACLDGRTLRSLPAPALGGRNAEVVADEGLVVVRRNDAVTVPELWVIREGQVETIGSPDEAEFASEPVIARDKLVVRRFREGSRAFCEVRPIDSPRVVFSVLENVPAYGALAATNDGIVVAQHGPGPRLSFHGWTGECHERVVLPGWFESGPVIDARGRTLAVVYEKEEWLLTAHEGTRLVWKHVSTRRDPQRRGFAQVAATPDGGVWLKTESRLTRLEADRSVRWSGIGGYGAPVADRDGVVYSHCAPDDDERFLEPRAPDGTLVFSMAGDYFPKAIDAWGRLLATNSSGHGEVVAIT
jgi:hypothetical protein